MGQVLEVLVISGSMGSGKTTVMTEASDLLSAAEIPHAALDLDGLAVGHFPGDSGGLIEDNLRCLWRNYASAGVGRLLGAEALDSSEKLLQIERSMPGAVIIGCRLTASLETMRDRVRRREPGMLQADLLARVSELEARLDAVGMERFRVDNDGRPLTVVAREVLRLAGWL